MTAQVISPVVPPALVTGPRLAGPGGRARTLPVASLAAAATGSLVCGSATIDCNGRLAEATLLAVLGWAPGTRLDIRVRDGLVLLTADPDAVFTITQPGQVRLPATVRHWCGLTPGSRVLLATDPAVGMLVVHPPAAWQAMLAAVHATVLGGETA